MTTRMNFEENFKNLNDEEEALLHPHRGYFAEDEQRESVVKLKKRLDIATDLYTMLQNGKKNEYMQLDSINIQKEIAEIYYLRDLYMGLNPKKQVSWGFQKLRSNHAFASLLDEIDWLEDSDNNSTFYEFCSLDALMYLGY